MNLTEDEKLNKIFGHFVGKEISGLEFRMRSARIGVLADIYEAASDNAIDLHINQPGMADTTEFKAGRLNIYIEEKPEHSDKFIVQNRFSYG